MTQYGYVFLVLLFSCVFIQPAVAEPQSLPPFTNQWTPESKAPETMPGTEALAQWMEARQYSLAAVRDGAQVPGLYALNLPSDLAAQTVQLKTRVFVRLLLPSVLQVNTIISQQRTLLLSLQPLAKSGALTAVQQGWLAQLANHYGLDAVNMDELLLRVDTVPVELALAQGIDESGWGTSRFAIEGNALFGQHASAHGDGKFIATADGKVKVAAFDSVYAAAASYIHNLNSTHAYHALRELRAQRRKAGKPVTGTELAGTLLFYSERGEAYVSDLRGIISHRHLERLDGVSLESTASTVVRFKR